MIPWTPGQEPPKRQNYDGWTWAAYWIAVLTVASAILYLLDEVLW